MVTNSLLMNKEMHWWMNHEFTIGNEFFTLGNEFFTNGNELFADE